MTSVYTDPDIAAIRPVIPRTPDGCEECLRLGTPWVHCGCVSHAGTSAAATPHRCDMPEHTPTAPAIRS
jgi:hypothetical protein